MWLVILIVLVLFLSGAFGYHGYRSGYAPAAYGSPVGLVLLLLVLVLLFR